MGGSSLALSWWWLLLLLLLWCLLLDYYIVLHGGYIYILYILPNIRDNVSEMRDDNQQHEDINTTHHGVSKISSENSASFDTELRCLWLF